MTTPTAQGLVCSDIPEEDSLVTAYTDESIIVLGDAQIVHFVTMGAVLLDLEASGRIEESDLSVGATGQELRRWSGVCDGAVDDGVETYVLA